MTHGIKLRRRFDAPSGRLVVLAALALAAHATLALAALAAQALASSAAVTFAAGDRLAWAIEALEAFSRLPSLGV